MISNKWYLYNWYSDNDFITLRFGSTNRKIFRKVENLAFRNIDRESKLIRKTKGNYILSELEIDVMNLEREFLVCFPEAKQVAIVSMISKKLFISSGDVSLILSNISSKIALQEIEMDKRPMKY